MASRNTHGISATTVFNLMALPAELRCQVFEYVLLGPLLTFDDYISVFPYADWNEDMVKDYQTISQRYQLLLVCRQFYAEASPIFRGKQSFELVVEPSRYAPESPAPYALANLGRWMSRTGIRSLRCRKQVKTISVLVFGLHEMNRASVFGNSYETDPSWWIRDVAASPEYGGFMAFDNLTHLRLEFGEEDTHLTAFLDIDEALEFTSRLSLMMDENGQRTLKVARTARKATVTLLE